MARRRQRAAGRGHLERQTSGAWVILYGPATATFVPTLGKGVKRFRELAASEAGSERGKGKYSLDRRTVARAFGTKLEAVAYCAGAGAVPYIEQ